MQNFFYFHFQEIKVNGQDQIKTFKAGIYNLIVRASNFTSSYQTYHFNRSGNFHIFLPALRKPEEIIHFTPGQDTTLVL